MCRTYTIVCNIFSLKLNIIIKKYDENKLKYFDLMRVVVKNTLVQYLYYVNGVYKVFTNRFSVRKQQKIIIFKNNFRQASNF